MLFKNASRKCLSCKILTIIFLNIKGLLSVVFISTCCASCWYPSIFSWSSAEKRQWRIATLRPQRLPLLSHTLTSESDWPVVSFLVFRPGSCVCRSLGQAVDHKLNPEPPPTHWTVHSAGRLWLSCANPAQLAPNVFGHSRFWSANHSQLAASP